MGREIKFRAWDKRLKKMTTGCTAMEGIWEQLTGDQNSQDQIIEQYTGLKDKNGVEIYEGDKMTCEMEAGPDQTGSIQYWNTHMGFILANDCNQNIGRTRNMWSADQTIKELPNGGIKGKVIGTIHDKE